MSIEINGALFLILFGAYTWLVYRAGRGSGITADHLERMLLSSKPDGVNDQAFDRMRADREFFGRMMMQYLNELRGAHKGIDRLRRKIKTLQTATKPETDHKDTPA